MVASSIASITSDAHSSEAESQSTLGTTASLSSRIASLTLDQHYGLRDLADGLSSVGGTSEGFPASIYECSEDGERGVVPGQGFGELNEYGSEGEGEEEEEEEVVELTESELLQYLDHAENPFQVCSRLFRLSTSQPWDPSCAALTHLKEEHVAHLLERGFVVVDGFLTADVASELRSAAMEMSTSGEMRPAAELDAGEHFSDRSARSDILRFVHLGQEGRAIEGVLKRMEELQEDLRQVVHLRRRQAEYQLAHYKGNGAFYKRHRDALPCGDTNEDQRRMTIVVYTNPSWEEAQGGALRLWPPIRPTAPPNNENGVVRIHDLRLANGGAASSNGGAPNGNGVDAPHRLAVVNSNGNGNGHHADHDTLSLDSHSVDSFCSHGRFPLNLCTALPHVKLSEDENGVGVMDVAPVAGRMVVFLSGCVDHEVLPSYSDRIALTAWCQ